MWFSYDAARQRMTCALATGLALLLGCSGGNPSDGAPAPAATTGTAQAMPTLALTTDSGLEITSREIYVPAQYRLTSEIGQVLVDAARLEIRGRGHSTWDLMGDKKPYRLRLAASTPLLGMPANRHWVLLANHSDKTMLRNDVAFELSRRLGMEYTPRSAYLELFINGIDRGLYQLVEHIRVGPDRVNIPELRIGDTTPDLISGGYLIEIDDRRGEAFCHVSTRTSIVFCLANPDKLAEPGWGAQRAYIERYLDETETAIFSDQFADPAVGYAAYLDVDSTIQFFLINELFKNVDADLRLSVFLYKKRNGKLTFGPVWDFDLAIGNVNYGNADQTSGWHVRNASWFARLFQDPAFEAKVRARWAQLKSSGTLDGMFDYIDQQARRLDTAQTHNFQLWPILNQYVWPNRVVTGSYAGEVAAMKAWLRERLRWMDAQLS